LNSAQVCLYNTAHHNFLRIYFVEGPAHTYNT